MKKRSNAATVLSCIALLFAAGMILPACEKKAETTGEKVDKAIDDAGDAADDAKDAAGDAADDAKKALEDK